MENTMQEISHAVMGELHRLCPNRGDSYTIVQDYLSIYRRKADTDGINFTCYVKGVSMIVWPFESHPVYETNNLLKLLYLALGLESRALVADLREKMVEEFGQFRTMAQEYLDENRRMKDGLKPILNFLKGKNQEALDVTSASQIYNMLLGVLLPAETRETTPKVEATPPQG